MPTSVHPIVQQARHALRRADSEGAARLCRQRLAEAPKDPNAHLTLSDAQMLAGFTEEALETLRTAARNHPREPMIKIKLAQAYWREGRLAETLDSADAALKLRPGLDAAIALKATVFTRQGKHSKADKLLAPVITAAKPPVWCGVPVMQLLIRQERWDDAVAFGDRYADRFRGSDARQQFRDVLFELARAHERRGEPERAFEVATEANTIFPMPWNKAQETTRLEAIDAATTAEALASVPIASVPEDAPPIVFIVGMPRSGSTLTERMLHAHPEATGIGEDATIHRIAYSMQDRGEGAGRYPVGMATWTQAMIDGARADAIRLMSAGVRRGRGRVIVNKNLGNALHLGLISRLFPEAVVIHTQRDPVDTCLSCYMEPLGGPGTGYAANLEALGWYHRRLDRMVAHAQEHCGLPILELRYEDLVADPEAGIRRILDHVGLEWNDACLAFHEVKRVERTLSHEQVNRPIYTSSVKRADKFGALLDPLRASLEANAPA